MTSYRQTDSRASVATDPIRNFKFHVVIQDDDGSKSIPQLGFTSVAGLGVSIDPMPYQESGMNLSPHKMPLQADFSPVTFTRGIVVGHYDIYDWMRRVFEVMQGHAGNSAGSNFRHMVDIFAIQHPVTTQYAQYRAQWRLYNAWPGSIVFGDFDAAGNGVLLQTMTLYHEGFDFILDP
ncbi:phage tail protein [Streptomyces sp. NPDC059443]|uniref:phage tail protein n=1 Tax=unclassified Streptomyces TaxID=2593676 RepID=UPI00369786E0